MIDLPAEDVEALPVDHLGLLLLADLVESKEWNEHNLLNAAARSYKGDALRAIAEAMGWLRARGLIARTPDKSSSSAIFVTRAGQLVVSQGPQVFFALERLQGGMHPLIEAEARPQFLVGKYDLGVFAAFKAVEIRVRSLGGYPEDATGRDLINKAFGAQGPLTDPDAPEGEKDGMRFLFAGAHAVLRNPAGHREVNYDDVTEAAEAVHTASMLMRILDRIEIRNTEADQT